MDYILWLDADDVLEKEDQEKLKLLKENLNNWDKSYEIAQNIKFITWPRKKIE